MHAAFVRQFVVIIIITLLLALLKLLADSLRFSDCLLIFTFLSILDQYFYGYLLLCYDRCHVSVLLFVAMILDFIDNVDL